MACLFAGAAAFISLAPWPAPAAFSQASSRAEKAQVVVYIETAVSTAEGVSLAFDSIVLAGDDVEVSLALRRTAVSSIDDAGRQVLLAEQAIQPGAYEWLRLYAHGVPAVTGDATTGVAVAGGRIDVAVDLEIGQGTAEPVFLTWTPTSVRRDGGVYAARVAWSRADIPPPGSLVFVSNEGSDNLSVVNRFSRRVVDVIKVGLAPRGLVYSPFSQQLFVANSGDNSIDVIDVPTRQPLRTVPLVFGDTPSRLELSPDERLLYVLNYGSSSLAVFDTQSFQEVGRYSLGSSPVGIATNRLSGYVYVTNRLSDNVNVYEPVNQSVTTTYAAGTSPTELILNSRAGSLYVCHDGQRTLTVLNARTGEQTGTMNLCSEATGLAYNQTSNQLYVASGRCSEIGVFKPENELNVGTVRLPDKPGLITIDPENRQLFAVLPEADALAVVNIITREMTAVIDTGHRPYQAVVPR